MKDKSSSQLPKRLAIVAVGIAVVSLAIAIGAPTWQPQRTQGKGPVAKEAAGPPPSQIYQARPKHKPPPLYAPGKDARLAVRDFLEWAGMSGADEREDARKVIAAARENEGVADALCEEVFRAQKEDHSRALLVLSVLGEMRSAVGAQCLNRFMNLPFPRTGTIVDGEIIEQTALATLQAKAIDGLAYLGTKAGDEAVLQAVAGHPSPIVRAEAVDAYLWNHRDSAEARRVLRQYVRKGEEIFLDRVRREDGERAETFNRKLKAFLKAHPEAVPPAPERDKNPQKEKRDEEPRSVKPPNW
jgi:hypothetical protein